MFLKPFANMIIHAERQKDFPRNMIEPYEDYAKNAKEHKGVQQKPNNAMEYQRTS